MKEEDKDALSEAAETSLLLLSGGSDEGTIRTYHLYGELNEEKGKEIVNAFSILRQTGKEEKQNEEDPDGEPITVIKPIEFLVSTEGGSVQDMFSIYDLMNDIQRECEIHTFGLGKVMSAGTLLLAAGTKGKRKLGRNCRLMMHSVRGGHFGSMKELEIDMKESKWYQEKFIQAMVKETNMTIKQLRSIFRKNTDTYFDAEQALKWGLCDEVV